MSEPPPSPSSSPPYMHEVLVAKQMLVSDISSYHSDHKEYYCLLDVMLCSRVDIYL
jgi:hypothetical protein